MSARPTLPREGASGPSCWRRACADAGIPLTLRRQPGYDHSYYFISTFMADHVALACGAARMNWIGRGAAGRRRPGRRGADRDRARLEAAEQKPGTRVAGVRTFSMLGLGGGIAGLLGALGQPLVAAALAVGAVAMLVIAYAPRAQEPARCDQRRRRAGDPRDRLPRRHRQRRAGHRLRRDRRRAAGHARRAARLRRPARRATTSRRSPDMR